MKIRQATARDKKFVRKLDEENMVPIFKKYNIAYKKWHNKMYDYFRTKFCFIIEEKGESLGYVYFGKDKNNLEIWNIQIKRNIQRKGIGKKLINFIIEHAKKTKLKKIILEVHGKNKKAIKFYEKMGFKNLGIINKEKEINTLPELE